MDDLKRLAEYGIPVLFVVIGVRAIGEAFEPVLMPLVITAVACLAIYLLIERIKPRKRE